MQAEEEFKVHDVKHLPIIAHYVRHLDIGDVLNQELKSQTTVSP